MKIAIGVPTLNNFKGLAELFASLWGEEYTPFVVSNWVENIGVSKAWNEILQTTAVYDYDLVVICNDDIRFVHEGIQNLRRGWENKPEYAIMVTATTHKHSSATYMAAPDYSCFAINPSEYLDKIGKFDENFTPAYFEDNDSHYRIQLAGLEAYNYEHALIEHKGSQTQNADPKNPVVTGQMFEKNKAYYVEKWGGVPGQEKFKVPYGDSAQDWKYWR